MIRGIFYTGLILVLFLIWCLISQILFLFSVVIWCFRWFVASEPLSVILLILVFGMYKLIKAYYIKSKEISNE